MGVFDAVIATCAVTAIPAAWIEQCPAGRIVAPFARPWSHSACVVLDVRADVASGRFLDGFAFMRMRGHRDEHGTPDTRQPEGVRESVSVLRPNRVVGSVSEQAAFAISLALPDCSYAAHLDREADSYILTVHDTAGSWATVEWTGDPEQYPVRQYGPRDLWNEITSFYRWWASAHYPPPERFGLTVTTKGESMAWLDRPDQPLNELVTAARMHD